jgi:hypothetical protein
VQAPEAAQAPAPAPAPEAKSQSILGKLFRPQPHAQPAHQPSAPPDSLESMFQRLRGPAGFSAGNNAGTRQFAAERTGHGRRFVARQTPLIVMKVITVVSAKGGVGKTTLAANLASVLAARGRRVIALDLDPQNALRLHFGIPLDSIDGLSRATLAGDPWQTVMFDGVDGVTVLPYGAVVEDDRRRFEAHIDRDPQWLAQSLETLRLDAATS